MSGRKFVIGVVSADRVGIISNVTSTVLRLDGNIDRMSQTVMDGCFTILITAVFPEATDADVIRRAVESGGGDLELHASVRPYAVAAREDASRRNVYFLTVVGADRKGVVHDITSCLADNGVNILDLYCFLRRNGEFVLIGEVDIPPALDLDQFQIDLEETGQGEPISVRLQHEDLFRATNELYFTRRPASEEA